MSEVDMAFAIEQQVTDYIRLGFHRHLDEKPRDFVERFLPIMEMAGSLAVPEADVVIMPVIPESLVSLEDQLKLSGTRAFLSSTDMRQVSTWDVEPQQPYALLGVSVGKDLRELSPNDAEAEIAKRGRTGLRLIELLSFGIHEPDQFTVEDIRGLYAVETLHDLNGHETIVDLYRYGDSLKVKRDPGTLNDPQWTTPSYQERIVAG